MPGDTTARKGASEQRGEEAGAPRGREPQEQSGRGRVPLPVPRIQMPSGTAGNVLWYGGLAAVAALGVVDWPVAALVAAGTWVAEQHARQSRREQAAAA